jgi:hypothetical protein
MSREVSNKNEKIPWERSIKKRCYQEKGCPRGKAQENEERIPRLLQVAQEVQEEEEDVKGGLL